jgi:hypothetical protein
LAIRLLLVPIGVGVGIGIGIDSDGDYVLWLVLTRGVASLPSFISIATMRSSKALRVAFPFRRKRRVQIPSLSSDADSDTDPDTDPDPDYHPCRDRDAFVESPLGPMRYPIRLAVISLTDSQTLAAISVMSSFLIRSSSMQAGLTGNCSNPGPPPNPAWPAM